MFISRCLVTTMARAVTLTITLTVFVSVSWAAIQSAAPIWLSPTNNNYNSVEDFIEQFPERGVWSNISVGAGTRRSKPLILMDSKKTLWISFGLSSNKPDTTTVWNYDPKTDLYRWVAGPGNSTLPRNPGGLGVPSPTNLPGLVYYTTATIDHNDNIWLLTTQYCCELWMFNTTSYLFTRMNGPTGGVPSMETACFVTDSKDNLWLISGIAYGARSPSNKVWHFNTTSLAWTFISGNDTGLPTVYGDNPLYGGRQGIGCDIDANDRVWLFGGLFALPPSTYSDVWSFDTLTAQWQLERGSNETTVNNLAKIVSDDFHPDNIPSARQGASVVDRQDGTLIVASGEYRSDVWLFNKTSKYWKLIYGNPSLYMFPGNLTHYRAPGSAMPGRDLHGTATGLNVDGDLFIYGGNANDVERKDVWLVPYNQCTNDATYQCGLNAHCVDEMIGYSCACDEGFTGDGQTCIPLPPISPPTLLMVPEHQPVHSSVSSATSIVVSLLEMIIFIWWI